MRLTVRDVALITGGTPLGEPTEVEGIALDSRRIQGGELFVPIREARDGHDFIAHAVAAGAAAYLTERPGDPGPGVRVEDCRAALRALAGWARESLTGEVVGVTGSVGKTTTKDLIAAAVAPRHKVHASVASFNNDLGVPHTLLTAPQATEVLVAEIGANAPGEIAAHCRMIRPTIGVLTRVAPAHTEGFGDIDAVAQEKSALIASLPSSGIAVLNWDDPRVMAMRALTDARIVTFGSSGDIRARIVAVGPTIQPLIDVDTPWGPISGLVLAVRGVHQVGNALAAIAVAASLGVDLNEIASALETAPGPPLRMDLRRAPSGALVLDDSYNANPASMEAALRALAALPARRRIAVLGVMAELGVRGPEEHRRIAVLGADLGIELLALDAPAYGVTVVTGMNAVFTALADLGDGDAVLVKGSRSARLDVVAARLRSPVE
jgi:UDP-N-acetylmuramoyl-tripeptide--D-alanyl-D-alanine ligase